MNDGHRLTLVRKFNHPVQVILTPYPINDDGRSFSRKYFYRSLSNGENIQLQKLLIQYFISVVNCLNLVHFLLHHIVTEIGKI